MRERPSHMKSFSRAQAASFAATIADFGTLVALVELAGLNPVPATAIGAVMGAITNFLLNRHWSFEATHDPMVDQAGRYALVALGSLLLNTGGVWLLTDVVGLKYVISKALTALTVGFVYNYPMHRLFVFR